MSDELKRIADALERIAVSHEAATKVSVELVKAQRQMFDSMAESEPEPTAEVRTLLSSIEAFSQRE